MMQSLQNPARNRTTTLCFHRGCCPSLLRLTITWSTTPVSAVRQRMELSSQKQVFESVPQAWESVAKALVQQLNCRAECPSAHTFVDPHHHPLAKANLCHCLIFALLLSSFLSFHKNHHKSKRNRRRKATTVFLQIALNRLEPGFAFFIFLPSSSACLGEGLMCAQSVRHHLR